MSQFGFPPLTANLNSEATNGGSLPSSVLVVAGYDGANVRAIKTDSTGEVQVDISSSALPSGAATSALQTAGNNLLTTIDADTSSIAGAVSGTEMQVDVVASLPAGTNAIGKLAANSGVDIGDVDVTSEPATAANGASSLPGVAKVVAGWDGSNVRALKTDSTGAIQMDIESGHGLATEAKQDVIETTLNSIEGDTSSLAGAVSGTEMQVDIVASLPAGTNNIGDVDIASALPAGTNTIGGVDIASALPAGTNNIGDVDIASALPAGTNNIGDVDIASALPAGTNTIGKVDVNAIAPVDFLDSGLIDTSTAAIASTGTTVVSSLASACTEIEIQEDIGEFMTLRVGGTIKAFLPLGGGRVKVSLSATDAVQLFSETGGNITNGKIAINFLG